MAEYAGLSRVILIATTSTGAGVAIHGVKDSTYRHLCDMLDITHFGDTHRGRKGGLLDTALPLSGSYDPADTTGQALLVPGNDVYIQVLYDGTSGSKIQMICENFEQGGSVDALQTFTSSLLGQAAPSAV